MKRRTNHSRESRSYKHRVRHGSRRLARQAESEAHRITHRLLSLAEGDIYKPLTWKRVAQTLSVRCYSATNFAGCYMRSNINTDSAMIGVNDDIPSDTQSRVWVHELAHHLLYEAQPPLPMETTTHYYNDEAGGIAHKIACRVETLILGVS